MMAREPRTEGRVVRKALLESERWLTLKDNADRLAFISLLLNCDDYGNYSGEPYRLMRMWRDFGITTTALVAKTLSELQDHDLIGLYDVENRPFIHVQRLFNTKQWWWRSFPKSPFEEDKDNPSKQRVSDLSIKPDLSQHKPGVRGKGLGVRGSSTSTTLSGKPDASDQFKVDALEILDYLNVNTGRAYRPVDSNIKLVIGRLKSGVTPLQCREVIFNKCQQWGKDSKMSEYLRPATLFNSTKFEQYLGELNAMS